MTLNSPTKAVWLLLLVCAIWGLMFVLVDRAIEYLSVHTFNTLRFAVATLCLWPLWRLDAEAVEQQLTGKGAKTLLLTSAGLALLMFVGFTAQTVGLKHTSVSNAGFITGLCVPLVPVLGLLLFKARIKPIAWLGVLCATVGIYFLTVGDKLVFNKGDLLVLVCAIAFALHIVITGRITSKFPLIPLCTLQLAAVSLYSAITALATESIGQQTLQALAQPIVWITVITSGALATALACWAQTASQRLLEPYKVGLIFSTEPLFAYLAAAIILAERLGALGWVGAALIIVGMLVAELGDRRKPQKVQPMDMDTTPNFQSKT